VLPHDQVAKLACDSDHDVRQALAYALRSADAALTPETQAIMETLALDVRRSVRVLAISESR
jgi:hypothetical protein